MKTQSIAQALGYDGDKIAQLFFDELTDANFHTEVKVLHAAYEAMQWAVPSDGCADSAKMIDAAIAALQKLRGL
jgi:hypothetical protein